MRPASTYGCSKAAMDYVLRGLWKTRAAGHLLAAAHRGLRPGRQTEFNVDTIVRAALAGKPARLDPLTDWPYIYVDDAADAAIAACFSSQRKQLAYFVAHPERVTPEDIAAACGAAGRPVRLEIDTSKPNAARGPVDVEAAARDFGFRAQVGHREGIRRMIEAAALTRAQALLPRPCRAPHSLRRRRSPRGFHGPEARGQDRADHRRLERHRPRHRRDLRRRGLQRDHRVAQRRDARRGEIRDRAEIQRARRYRRGRSVRQRECRPAREGFSRHRHSGEQCRRDSGRHAARRERGDLAQGVGPEGVRLRQHVPRASMR